MARMTTNQLHSLLDSNPDLALADPYQQPVTGLAQAIPVVRVSERDLQASLFRHIDSMATVDPRYLMIAAIPNGQYRKGQRMEPGLKAGFPDIGVFVPRAATGQEPAYHGAFLELKANNNQLDPMQEVWLSKLRQQGYYCKVIRDSLQAAIEIISWYLGEK